MGSTTFWYICVYLNVNVRLLCVVNTISFVVIVIAVIKIAIMCNKVSFQLTLFGLQLQHAVLRVLPLLQPAP